MGKYFGTDGVRGEANVELTPELAFKLGRFGGFCISRKAKSKTTENILYIRVGKLSPKDSVNVCKSRRNFYIRCIQLA